MTDAPAILEAAGGVRLAYRSRVGTRPTLLFLAGYASDMDGTKALAIDRFAAERGLGMLRFDYSGTGLSGGRFEDGTLSAWLEETLTVIDRLSQGPVIPIGSSMGGWLALLAALRRPERVAALVGIAAAPDFTDWGYSDADKAALARDGRLEVPSPYGPEVQLTTHGFWQSGQKLLLLGETVALDCPVRLIHGDRDGEVPLDIALRLMRALRSADVQLTVIKAGGHRLSEPHEIDAILAAVASLVEKVS